MMKYLLEGQETERLNFRLFQKSDFDVWLDLFNGENVALFLGMDTSLSKKMQCELWFAKVFNRYEKGLGGMNVLIDIKTNQLVGQCGLLIQDIEGEERLEIGYSILPEHWNKGYATEAAQKCKNYAFENQFYDSLISMVHIDNIGSKKVALKNGMKLEKFIKDFKGGPVNIFKIDKEEWQNNNHYDKK